MQVLGVNSFSGARTVGSQAFHLTNDLLKMVTQYLPMLGDQA